ncbi:MAG: methyltransferase domain-containing protein [Gammaproteobacteria bacterium]
MKIKPLLLGLASYLPGAADLRAKRTGGTDSARYCYSAWLRHLTMARDHGFNTAPCVIAELGPGDSLGIGLAALLSGAERYFAFDVVAHAQLENNLHVFETLVELFKNRTPIPGNDEFPRLKPHLDNYTFPADILTEQRLETALQDNRLQRIRDSLHNPNTDEALLVYKTPWSEAEAVQECCVDMIYSQAVLEHIDDLASAYAAMRRWLKPDGFMSHQIDYKCHGTASEWNGHWTYSETLWRLIRGKRPYLLNRAPHSEHLRLLQEHGFTVVAQKRIHTVSKLSRTQLAGRFKHLCDDDLTTSGAFILAQPRAIEL